MHGFTLLETTAAPSLSLIPSALKAADFSRVIFIKSTGGLGFQSRIHCSVWRQHGAALVAGVDTATARPA